MTQTTQSSNITNEENKLVIVEQAGRGSLMYGRIYKNYEFKYKLQSIDDEKLINTFYDIGIEFIKKTAPDNVIMLLVRLAQKEKAKREKRRIYTPPVYVEDGKTGDLKSKLKSGEYDSAVWADYMFYHSHHYKAYGFIPAEVRRYLREIIVLQEHTDLSLAGVMDECGKETWGFGIKVFPHKKIELCDDKKMTAHKYFHSDDFMFDICPGGKSASIVIEPNPAYMSYEDVLSVIEPLFEKYGFHIEDKTDPYIYYGFPPDYQQHNKYNLGGYEFID